MSSANVADLEVIQSLRETLVHFAERLIVALSTTDAEITGAYRFLEERKHSWSLKLKELEEYLVEAKLYLGRKELDRFFGYKIDATVAEEEVRKAKVKRNNAETKIQNIKKWKPKLDHMVRDYTGPKLGLLRWAETDVPRAIALLDSKLDALEKYLALIAPDILAGRKRPEVKP